MDGRLTMLFTLNFLQSLVLAGLFAWMEGLFALGYRPKLQAELHSAIEVGDAQLADSTQTDALLKHGSSSEQ